LIAKLENAGYSVLDMTHNDTARLHLRHMIGGHAGLSDEKLYRFRFPERPGALLNFLKAMGSDWNISLFHYRNHGAAYGRVLVGMQLPVGQEDELRAFIDNLGYVAEEESDNGAYTLFLN